MTEINGAFREHVTRTGFDLSLGKTHIMALVWVDLLLKENVPTDRHQDNVREFSTARPGRTLMSSMVPGMNGVIDRGLVENITEQRRKPGESSWQMTPRRKWRITPAGRLVVNLLKEAGIYQEFAALVPIKPGREEAS